MIFRNWARAWPHEVGHEIDHHRNARDLSHQEFGGTDLITRRYGDEGDDRARDSGEDREVPTPFHGTGT